MSGLNDRHVYQLKYRVWLLVCSGSDAMYLVWNRLLDHISTGDPRLGRQTRRDLLFDDDLHLR